MIPDIFFKKQTLNKLNLNMKKTFFLFSLILFAALFLNAVPQDKTECLKTFKFSGPGANGVQTEGELVVKKRYDEFTPEEKVAQTNFEKTKYTDFDYTYIGEPSELYDCAGYVIDKLWKTGQYRVGGPNFTTTMIKKFGVPISGTFGWGSAKENDIVVYEKDGVGNHIALVKEVTTKLGVTTSVTIETKDGSESIYLHTLPDYTAREKVYLLNDPLVVAWGTPNIYRIDPKVVTMTQDSPGECDEAGDVLSDSLLGMWYMAGYSLEISGTANSIRIIYKQDPGYTTTVIDPRKFSSVKLVGDKIIGRFESNPMYEDPYINRKGKITGSFEMGLVKSSVRYQPSTLEGTAVFDGEYCKGCIETWTWHREKQNQFS